MQKIYKTVANEYYRENVVICCKGSGKDDLISFHDMTAYLINVKYKYKNDFINDKIKTTLLTAVEIIKNEIRNRKFNNDFYLTPTNIADLKVGENGFQIRCTLFSEGKMNFYPMNTNQN